MVSFQCPRKLLNHVNPTETLSAKSSHEQRNRQENLE